MVTHIPISGSHNFLRRLGEYSIILTRTYFALGSAFMAFGVPALLYVASPMEYTKILVVIMAFLGGLLVTLNFMRLDIMAYRGKHLQHYLPDGSIAADEYSAPHKIIHRITIFALAQTWAGPFLLGTASLLTAIQNIFMNGANPYMLVGTGLFALSNILFGWANIIDARRAIAEKHPQMVGAFKGEYLKAMLHEVFSDPRWFAFITLPLGFAAINASVSHAAAILAAIGGITHAITGKISAIRSFNKRYKRGHNKGIKPNSKPSKKSAILSAIAGGFGMSLYAIGFSIAAYYTTNSILRFAFIMQAIYIIIMGIGYAKKSIEAL